MLSCGPSPRPLQLLFMGLNWLEEEGESSDEGAATSHGSLPRNAWHRLARRAEACFQSTPAFHFM